MSKMNLPNKLTIFRVILIVPFIILLLGGQAGWFGENTFVTDMIALAIFIIASLTDLIDGKIARKYNLITDFGKFMDPLADKLLVCSAMIALIEMNRIPSWVVIIIIAREFIISGFRLIASDNGVVIAASYWGKFNIKIEAATRMTAPIRPMTVTIRTASKIGFILFPPLLSSGPENGFHDAAEAHEGQGGHSRSHQGDGQALEALGGDGLLHPAAHAGEQDHGHQEADAGAGGADDALREIIAIVDVQDGHAQDGAVGGDQGQIHTQRLVQRGDELLQHVLQQLHQDGDDQDEHDGLEIAQVAARPLGPLR